MTALATEQEIPLPQEIARLGRPQQVHEGRMSSMSLLLLFASVFFLLSAGFCVFIYFKVPIKKNNDIPPETMLYIAGGIAFMALLCLAAWKGNVGAGSKAATYLVYPEALALLKGDSFDIVRWNEVTQLVSPRNLGDYHITTQDGRTFPIKHAVKDYSNLIAAVFTHVSAQLLPPLRNALDAGETVGVGPFALSQESITYKGKTLSWDNVAALEIQIGQGGRRLRIRASGSIVPWCWANLDAFPNGVFLAEVLRHVCPRRLLVPA
jgi:hypothetical protein